MTMRIKLTQHCARGACGGFDAVRVYDLAEGEPVPEGAEQVGDDVKLMDWTPTFALEAAGVPKSASGRGPAGGCPPLSVANVEVVKKTDRPKSKGE